MNKIFLIQPRRSGKTTKAMYEYIKDPDNTIFVVHNHNMVKHIFNIVGGNIKNIITENQLLNLNREHKPKNIILDEYMYFESKVKIYDKIYKLEPENLFIFSTSDRKYDANIFKFVRENKHKYSYGNLIRKYNGLLLEGQMIDISDLYYNFITDYDTKVIDICFERRINNDDKMLHIVGRERYDIEWLNKYLTDIEINEQ